MTSRGREDVTGKVWTIEVYHRGLKQFCGVERCQARSARAQRNHIGWAVRAFLRLEHHRIMTGTSWFETKMEIIRSALRLYLSQTSPILVGLAQSPSTAYLLDDMAATAETVQGYVDAGATHLILN